MLESFQETDRVPDFWKIWAMFTRSEAGLPTRAWRTLGSQAMVNSGPSVVDPTACGMTSGPPGTIVTSRPTAW